jgi:Na+-transporting NADH:ubiquinone oxidoreductase subunit C
MNPHPRWLLPAALVALAPAQALAVQYLTAEQAQGLIFPQAREFVPATVTLSAAQIEEIGKRAGVPVRVAQQRVLQARAEGRLLGWILLDEVYGKHELISYALGINPDGTVRQLEILEYREAYGYQVRTPAWRRQFVGKSAADPVKLDTDILNITGATLSCRHLTEGVRRLLAFTQVALR